MGMCPDADENLKRQLALLKQLEGRGLARASEFFARQGEAAPPGPRRAPLDRFFPEAARIEAACGGACRIVQSQASLSGRRTAQGYQCPVAGFGGPPRPEELAELTGDPRWANLDPTRILYLDTETTSLAQGTGTYTFLIGLGHFEADGAFTVEQYFMEDYADEGAVVEVADAAFERAQALVSYNGRTFDVPLLESRWRLQRRRPRFPELHLDLLHYARRLWRLRLPDCSLSTVEREILGVTRLSDVDGSWVPRIYFDFTRGQRPERIVPVFDHHAQDIYSLAALVAAMRWAYRNPEDERFSHAADQWGLARLYELHGRTEEALERMEAAVLAARDEDFGFRLAMHLAKTYKRHGRLGEALAIWEARVAQANPQRLDPLLELAKHAEHTLKDYALAQRWAERAMALIQVQADMRWLTDALEAATGSSGVTPQSIALAHRLARLGQRKARAETRAAAPKRPRAKKNNKENE